MECSIPGPWNYPETVVKRQSLLIKVLWNYKKEMCNKTFECGFNNLHPYDQCLKNCTIAPTSLSSIRVLFVNISIESSRLFGDSESIWQTWRVTVSWTPSDHPPLMTILYLLIYQCSFSFYCLIIIIVLLLCQFFALFLACFLCRDMM